MACQIDYSNMNNIRICMDDVPTGGLQELHYGVFSELEPLMKETEGVITGVTEAKLKKIVFNKKDNATKFNEVTTNETNGSQVIVPTVNVQLNGLNKATRDAAESLSRPAVRLVIFAKTVDGVVWCIGRKYGLIASSVTSGTGTGSADFNGYTITFTGEEDDNIMPATITAA